MALLSNTLSLSKQQKSSQNQFPTSIFQEIEIPQGFLIFRTRQSELPLTPKVAVSALLSYSIDGIKALSLFTTPAWKQSPGHVSNMSPTCLGASLAVYL